MADLVRDGDGQRWIFPGQGEVPLRETIAALDAAGFDGFYSFKWEKIWNPISPSRFKFDWTLRRRAPDRVRFVSLPTTATSRNSILRYGEMSRDRQRT